MTTPHAPLARSTASRFLAPLLAFALLLGASALAQNQLFVIDDSTVVYGDADDIRGTDKVIEEAYLTFAPDGDAVVIAITTEAGPTSIPAKIAFNVPDLEREDFFGTDVGAELADVKDFRVHAQGDDVATSNRITGCAVTHLDVRLKDAADAYRGAFEALGFTVADRTTVSRNVLQLELSRDGRTVLTTLRQRGTDVLVDIDRS